MEQLLSIDTAIFQLINQMPHTILLDGCASMASGLGYFIFIWIGIGGWILFKQEQKDHWFFWLMASVGSVGWILSEWILKPLIARDRPFIALTPIVLYPTPNGYAFPSTHSVIAFSMAYIITRKMKRFQWAIWLTAILIAWSRIYSGHHFPLDVIGGAGLGLFLGWIGYSIYLSIKSNQQKNKKHITKKEKTV